MQHIPSFLASSWIKTCDIQYFDGKNLRTFIQFQSWNMRMRKRWLIQNVTSIYPVCALLQPVLFFDEKWTSSLTCQYPASLSLLKCENLSFIYRVDVQMPYTLSVPNLKFSLQVLIPLQRIKLLMNIYIASALSWARNSSLDIRITYVFLMVSTGMSSSVLVLIALELWYCNLTSRNILTFV